MALKTLYISALDRLSPPNHSVLSAIALKTLYISALDRLSPQDPPLRPDNESGDDACASSPP